MPVLGVPVLVLFWHKTGGGFALGHGDSSFAGITPCSLLREGLPDGGYSVEGGLCGHGSSFIQGASDCKCGRCLCNLGVLMQQVWTYATQWGAQLATGWTAEK